MPKRWYALAFAVLILWGVLIWLAAAWLQPGLSEKGARIIELSGTLLTLLPVGLDLIRKLYIRRQAPDSPEEGGFSQWAQQRVWEALLGYESLYAWAIFLGVSLVALGFAIDLARPD